MFPLVATLLQTLLCVRLSAIYPRQTNMFSNVYTNRSIRPMKYPPC